MNTVQAQFMGRAVASFLLLAALLGCAGEQAHRDGMRLVEEGRAEEGLAKLSEAAHAAPDNLKYRVDLLRNRLRTVERMLTAASSERAAGHRDAAKVLYETVLRIDPGNARATLGLEALDMDQRHDAAIAQAESLLKKHEPEAARDALKPVLVENPENNRAQALQRQIENQLARETMAEPSLKTTFSKPVTLQFRDANLKMVFEALSRTSGINVLLDKDVRPDLKASLFVKDVSVEDVIDLILLQNQLEKKVISDNTVFIYPATPAKLKDYQDLQIRSFHLVHADAKEMLTMLKTILKTKDLYVDEKTNSIVIRDTPDAVRLAEKMVADQDVAAPEVMLEVEVLEVSRSLAYHLGVVYPDQFTVATPDKMTLSDLRSLSSSDLGASALSATLNLHLDDTDDQVLASPRLRVRNHEKAKIMIGDRVPVISNSVTPLATGAAVTTGTIQYLDVGLKLEAEPDIHPDNQVVIKLGLEVSTLGKQAPTGASGTVAYTVGTRNASTVLRLKDGETQILGGLISDSDLKDSVKIPGLGQIPILGWLFSNHNRDKSKSEIVLAITPHIVGSASLPDANNEKFWSGTESSVRDGLLNISPMGHIAATTSESASPFVRPRPGAAPAQGGPAAAALSLSWQGPAQVKQGDKLILTLDAQAQQPVGSLGMQVHFDPAVFKASDVAEGTFMKQVSSSGPPVLTKTIDQESGQIQLNLARDLSAGASGGGSVVTLVFEAKAANPQSRIVVDNVVAAAPGGQAVAATPPAPYVVGVQP